MSPSVTQGTISASARSSASRLAASDSSDEAPATVLNSILDETRAAGKRGIPGSYVIGEPGAVDEAPRRGSLSFCTVSAGPSHRAPPTDRCPVMRE
jgi:glutathione-independent formaldehyde dehydrogenase